MNQTDKQQKRINALRERLREVETKINTPEYLKLLYKSNSKYETLTVEEQKKYEAILLEKKPLLNKSRRLKGHIKDEREKLCLLKRHKPFFDVIPNNHN